MKKLDYKKILKFIISGALAMFAAIQLIPVEHSNPPIESEISTSPEVKIILHRACYDCHSNQTTWAWYSKVAPASWLIAYDVLEGRKELNFSTWGNYNPGQLTKKLKKSWVEIAENEMPPWSYLLMHKRAALSAEEREILHKWIVDETVR